MLILKLRFSNFDSIFFGTSQWGDSKRRKHADLFSKLKVGEKELANPL